MENEKVQSLRAERSRLLTTYQSAHNSHKNALIVRIDDIDESLLALGEEQQQPKVRPRRFIRK